MAQALTHSANTTDKKAIHPFCCKPPRDKHGDFELLVGAPAGPPGAGVTRPLRLLRGLAHGACAARRRDAEAGG